MSLWLSPTEETAIQHCERLHGESELMGVCWNHVPQQESLDRGCESDLSPLLGHMSHGAANSGGRTHDLTYQKVKYENDLKKIIISQ